MKLADEGHWTKVALERSFPGVRSYVIHEVYFLSEGSRAQLTPKRSLASVNSQVDVKAVTPHESLAAISTSVQHTTVRRFRSARTACTVISGRELLTHMCGRQVIPVFISDALSSDGACNRQINLVQKSHRMKNSTLPAFFTPAS